MLEGKVAIVTGGTRGIGFSIVTKFLENKAHVCVLGSRSETVDEAIKKIKEINPKYEVLGFYPNLNKIKEVEEVFNKVEKEWGKIDILVNNAGIAFKY